MGRVCLGGLRCIKRRPDQVVSGFANRGIASRCCKHALRRETRWRQQPSSATRRRWRVRAQRLTSRRAACHAREALAAPPERASPRPCVRLNMSETAVHATRAWQHWTCDTGAQPERWQACRPYVGHAFMIRDLLPRCGRRAPRDAPRGALRRRRQPSSGSPRWTRRATRRGRPPCARRWRWAPGR